MNRKETPGNRDSQLQNSDSVCVCVSVCVLLGEKSTRGANLFELVSFAENVGPNTEEPGSPATLRKRN